MSGDCVEARGSEPPRMRCRRSCICTRARRRGPSLGAGYRSAVRRHYSKGPAYERLLQSDVTAAADVLKPRSGPRSRRPTDVICHIATTISKRRWRRLAAIGGSSLLATGVSPISFVLLGCSLSPTLSRKMRIACLVKARVNRHPY